MPLTGIIALEGADSSGKTTLARYLRDRYNARYLHNTTVADIWCWHVGAARRASRIGRDELIVVDRHWLSELVYGPVFRGQPRYDVGARCLDRVYRRFGAVTVLCAPSDQREQEARWQRDRASGKFEHFDRVREVIQLYADLRHGNVAHPGDAYLDQLIRFQDFSHRDDVVLYDIDVMNPPKGAARALAKLKELQKTVIPYLGDNLAGRIDEAGRSVVLVGEEVSPRCATQPPRIPRWPFVDRDTRLTAATWLNEAIHRLALREDNLVFTNARQMFNDDGDYLPLLAERHLGARFIALGRVAGERLRHLGVRHKLVPHPQWHRRFCHGEGVEGYAERLREALR